MNKLRKMRRNYSPKPIISDAKVIGHFSQFQSLFSVRKRNNLSLVSHKKKLRKMSNNLTTKLIIPEQVYFQNKD